MRSNLDGRALPALYGLPNVEITVLNLERHEYDESNLRVAREVRLVLFASSSDLG